MSGKYPVFVLDDDEAVRDSLVHMLAAQGFDSRGFASERSFFAEVGPGEAGCLILDVRLAECDGLDLQDDLRRQGYLLAVIVMTGHGDVSTAVRALKAGAIDFLEKPFGRDAIVTAVGRSFAELDRRLGDRDAVSHAEERMAQLTPRELDVLQRLMRGLPNKSIAQELDISPRTVEVHRARIMEKTGAESLPHLVRLGLAAGLAPQDR